MKIDPVRGVEKIWGGTRLAERFGLAGRVGEAHIHRPDEDGPPPVLLKWIEAQEPLSVQCHPRNPPRKDEAWWFMEPPRDGFVYAGVRPGVTVEKILAARSEDLDGLLEKVPAARGEVLFLPSGIVHALTPGAVVFEAQEPNETTYRLHDWGRGRPLDPAAAAREADIALRAGRLGRPGPDGIEITIGVSRVTFVAGPARVADPGLCVPLAGEARDGAGEALPWGRAVRAETLDFASGCLAALISPRP